MKINGCNLLTARGNMEAVFSDAGTIKSDWYQNANAMCAQIASEWSIDIVKVAKVVSVLSPMNKWETCVESSKAMIAAFCCGGDIDSFSVSNFSANKIKAWGVLNETRDLERSSRKTFSFYKNMLLDPNFVTIDLWHLRICFGMDHSTGISPKNYDILSELTIDTANRMGMVGYDFQAIMWQSFQGLQVTNLFHR